MKKLLAITLTFILVLSLMSVATVTASAFTEGDYEYEFTAGSTAVRITRYVGTGGNVTIPSTIAGVPVTNIGDHAFDYTFLTSITIPKSVTTIGGQALYRCTSLKSITVESGNPVYHSAGNCLIETASKTLVAGCQTSVIPNDGSVTSIGEYAFYGCDSLTSIMIPNSVTSIGEYAFSGSSLVGVTLPDSVTTIGAYAFSGSSLVGVTLPDSVTTISEGAFSNCKSLASVVLPNSLTKIEDSMFSACTYLSSITIPKTVKTVGYYAFYNCSNLGTVYYGSTEKGRNRIAVFENPGSHYNQPLLDATWVYTDPEAEPGVYYTVYDSDATRTVSLKSIYNDLNDREADRALRRDFVMYGAPMNYRIIITAKAPKTTYAFPVIQSTTGNEITFDVGADIQEKISTSDSIVYTNILGSQFGEQVPSKIQIKKDIGDYNTLTITHVTVMAKREKMPIPRILTDEEQYDYEFINSNTAVRITGYYGDGVNVTIPSTLGGKPVTEIGYEAFKEENALTSVAIPTSVTAIRSYAFYGCSFSSVNLPLSVITIADNAFANCINLKTVYYGGSQTTQKAMIIGDNNDYLLNATWNYAIDESYVAPSQEPSTEPSQEPSKPADEVPGDATGDGSVDMKDVLTIRKTIAGLGGDVDKEAADVDGDGELTMKDVLTIRKFIAGLIEKLGK